MEGIRGRKRERNEGDKETKGKKVRLEKERE